MSIIGEPSLGGKKLPQSIDFAAVGWGQHLAKRLVRFKEIGGKGDDVYDFTRSGVPITDIEYWSGRWVLCSLRLETETGEGLTLADAVVAVSRERYIVSTAVAGRNGTVKEYVSDGDWSVNMVVGLQHVGATGEIEDEWPEDELRSLMKMLKSEGVLRVYSKFLDAMGIDRIVVKSYSMSQMTESNYQAVSISAVSDEEYNIYSYYCPLKNMSN